MVWSTLYNVNGVARVDAKTVKFDAENHKNA
jgi:hypothetical protein